MTRRLSISPPANLIVITGVGLGIALMIFILGILAITSLISIDPVARVDGQILTPRVMYVLKSSGLQAALSAICSLALAIPASVVMARRYSWVGMALMRLALPVAMVTPTAVAASGLLAVWGRQGMVMDSFRAINSIPFLPDIPALPAIYGLHGVILAHIFFNAPLMIKIFLPRILSVPDNRWRLARLTGMNAFDQFRLIEWPTIRRMVAPILVLVFMFCFSSFALVLMLGGGPAVTTLEVEIYSAVRIESDLAKAALLTCLQLLVAGGVLLFMTALPSANQAVNLTIATMKHGIVMMLPSKGKTLMAWDLFWMLILALVVVAPIAAIIIKGLSISGFDRVMGYASFWRALSGSLIIALSTSLVVTAFALILAESRTNLETRRRLGGRIWSKPLAIFLDISIMAYLVIPAIVIGTSAFILLRGVADLFAIAPLLVLLANVLLGLPVAFRLLYSKTGALAGNHDKLAISLGLTGWTRFRYCSVPVMGHEIGFVIGLAAAMSMGDLGVIALFASPNFQTLPWFLFQLSGRYDAQAAAATALLLMALTMLVFFAGTMIGRLLARTPSVTPTNSDMIKGGGYARSN